MAGPVSDRRARTRRRPRHEELTHALGAAGPVTWQAGWGGRIAGGVLLGLHVFDGRLARLADWPVFGSPAWYLQAALLAAASWIICWLALWRVTADRDGLWIRRLGLPQHVPWHTIHHVERSPGGLLTVVNREDGATAGWFAPPRLAALVRRPDRGQDAADVLSIMARCPELRPLTPATPAERGTPLGRYVLVAFAVVLLSRLV